MEHHEVHFEKNSIAVTVLNVHEFHGKDALSLLMYYPVVVVLNCSLTECPSR